MQHSFSDGFIMIQPNLSSPAYYSLDHAVGLSQNLDFNLLSFFLLILILIHSQTGLLTITSSSGCQSFLESLSFC